MKVRAFILTAGAAFVVAASAAQAATSKNQLACVKKSNAVLTIHNSTSKSLSSSLRRPLSIDSSDRLSLWQSRKSCTTSKSTKIATAKLKHQVRKAISKIAAPTIVPAPVAANLATVPYDPALYETAEAGSYYGSGGFVEYSHVEPAAVDTAPAGDLPQAEAPADAVNADAPQAVVVPVDDVPYWDQLGS